MKVTTKLKVLNIVIIISAIISVLVSYELTKGAELDKLNFLHIKHNQLLRDRVLEFSEAQVPFIRGEIQNIMHQSLECSNNIGYVEHTFLKLLGTHSARDLCINDIAQGIETIESLDKFEAGNISHQEMITNLNQAACQFSLNSAQLEPLVDRTVSTLYYLTSFIVMIKAMLVVLIVLVLLHGIERDYLSLEDLKKALAASIKQFQQIFDTVPVRIFYKDEHNTILKLNKAAAESLGGKPEDLKVRILMICFQKLRLSII